MRRRSARAWRPLLVLALATIAAGALCTAASWPGAADVCAGITWVLLAAGAVCGLRSGELGIAEAEDPRS